MKGRTNMNKIVKCIFFALVAVAFTACNKDLLDVVPSDTAHAVTFNADGTMNVTVNMEIPGMTLAATRTMGETPNYGDLSLYLLVFEEGEGLKQYEKLEADPSQTDGAHSHNNLVTFKVELEPTEKNAVVHLIATDQPEFDTKIGYGSEEYVIPSLYTDENHEAYWQRIALERNIPSAEQAKEDPAQAEAIAQSLSHVPMVRNFCRVSVKVADKVLKDGKFELTGLYVVNTVDRGSVAPYVVTNEGYQFVDYCDGVKGRNYAEISEQSHIGSMPTGVQLINRVETVEASESDDITIAPVYFYERPARPNSTERTYAIIRGNFDNKKTYYKVELGYIVDDDVIGVFEPYNLLRNFDYVISLNVVDGPGYSTMKEAAQAAPFNNFSASVEARNMLSMSDGDDMLTLSFISFVFTQPGQEVDLLAQFREDIANGKGGTIHNDLLKIKWEKGEVIYDIPNADAPESVEKGGTQWNKYIVKGQTPDEQLRQQTIYIYRGKKDTGEYGLYRVVNFFSHLPWEFVHIDTYAGLWEDPTKIPKWDEWADEDQKREIDHKKGAPLTLFFELPVGLPQAIFPLEFVVESDRQNIQNAYVGSSVVRSVPAEESLFATDPTEAIGKPTTSRIQYVKTVTWEDYYGEYNDELVGKGNAIVRCRFYTITDLNQDGVGGNGTTGKSETVLRVYNPYFGTYDKGKWKPYCEDGFIRDTATPDPTPGGGYDPAT